MPVGRPPPPFFVLVFVFVVFVLLVEKRVGNYAHLIALLRTQAPIKRVAGMTMDLKLSPPFSSSYS